MKFRVHHRTRYAYATPVKESFNEVRLEPVSNEHQTVEGFVLKVLPPPRLRTSPQGAEPGAGSIHEDAIVSTG